MNRNTVQRRHSSVGMSLHHTLLGQSVCASASGSASASALKRSFEGGATQSSQSPQAINLGLLKLNRHRPSPAELARQLQIKKIHHKEKPRPSKNGIPKINLNCQVTVNVSDQFSVPHQDTVRCRHLAEFFALHRGKKSDLMKPFSTPAGIFATFDGRLLDFDQAFRKAVFEAPQDCKHVVCSHDFGRYLKALAHALEAEAEVQDAPQEANCLLLTDGHAMAMHLQHKSKHGVNYFVLKVYDPNDTASYVRVERQAPEDLGKLKLDELLITPKVIGIYGGDPKGPLSLVAVSLDHAVQPKIDRKLTAPTAANMYAALSCGVQAEVQAMLNASPQKQDDLFHLLQAKSLLTSTPGLSMAFQHGYAETIGTFAQAVLASNSLTTKEKVELLTARRADGAPGLLIAFQRGQSDAVKVFMALILNSPVLSADQKTELLAAQRDDGMTGLSMAHQGVASENGKKSYAKPPP